MPEPLKNLYSNQLINEISGEFKKVLPRFNCRTFSKQVLSSEWDQLELKARMRHIATVLGNHLPASFPEAVEVLLPVSDKFSGLQHMLFPEFIEQFGQQHFAVSMRALEYLTAGSSSEYAIRPFIIQSPDKTMKQMAKWSRSKNEHVRRLSSEGCRPRLPWAMALPEYKKNPQAVLDIILNLLNDKSLYVRRSVANNLNDISKDNPQLIINIARQQLGKSPNIDWVIKHGCRSLLKQGDRKTLPLFGYKQPKHVSLDYFKVDKQVSCGDKLNFEFELQSNKQALGKLRLEFIIDFMKSNGKTSGKIFKIAEGDYSEKKLKFTRYFSFKKITTRKYYPGEHLISIVINGNIIASQKFMLLE